MPPRSERINGTAVAIGLFAVLLRGDSGRGKSSLALQLIERHRAMLIADDAVTATADENGIVLHPVAGAEGMIEVRGVGIVSLPYARAGRLRLVVELAEQAERLPERTEFSLLGIEVPLIRLRHPSADAVLQALRHVLR